MESTHSALTHLDFDFDFPTGTMIYPTRLDDLKTERDVEIRQDIDFDIFVNFGDHPEHHDPASTSISSSNIDKRPTLSANMEEVRHESLSRFDGSGNALPQSLLFDDQRVPRSDPPHDEASGVYDRRNCSPPHELASLPESGTVLLGSSTPSFEISCADKSQVKENDNVANKPSSRTRKRQSTNNRSHTRRKYRKHAFSDEQEYFPSKPDPTAARNQSQSAETVGDGNCLRLDSVHLHVDGESLRFTWNRRSSSWECKEILGKHFASGEVIGELVNTTCTELLRVWVRIDDLLLKFTWNSDHTRWEAVDINGVQLEMERDEMSSLISNPTSCRWAHMY